MKRLIFAIAAVFFFAGVAEAQVRVRGYTRADGTYVAPHYRSSPNRTTADNYSTRGNINPYTGAVGTKAPDQSAQYSGPSATYIPPAVIVPAPPTYQPALDYSVSSYEAPTSYEKATSYPTPADPVIEAPTFQTGADLYQNCGPLAPESALSQCYGYIAGVHDSVTALAASDLINQPYCLPDTMTVGQLATYSALAIPYETDRMTKDSFWVLMDVWSVGYPCQSSTPVDGPVTPDQ